MNCIDVLIFSAFLVLNLASDIRGEETTAQFGSFGKIFLYQPSESLQVEKAHQRFEDFVQRILPFLKNEQHRLTSILLYRN